MTPSLPPPGVSTTVPPMAPPPPSPPTLLPPAGISWPMVAYVLARELVFVTMILAGATVAIVFLQHSNGSGVESLVAALAPVLVAALAKSQPAESSAVLRMLGQGRTP